jgi:hypothetical protein
VYFLLAYREGCASGFGTGRYKLTLALLGGYFLLTTGTWDVLIGRPWNLVSQHYRLITYGTLLLIVPLVLCRPSYLVVAIPAAVPEPAGKETRS